MRTIESEIREGKILLCDGATGTLLIERMAKQVRNSIEWVIHDPKVLYGIACEYLDAGADMIETNTFGGNPERLKIDGIPVDSVDKLNMTATMLCRQAAGFSHHVAGSIGPSGRMGVLDDFDETKMYNTFAAQAKALEVGGADTAIIETMSDPVELSSAVNAVLDNTKLEVIASATYYKTPKGEIRTMMGSTIKDMCDAAITAGAPIIGVNCVEGIDLAIEITSEIRKLYPDIPIIAQPNAGKPIADGDTVAYPETPEYMASKLGDLIKAGANIVGGCCGTTPAHTKAFREVLEKMYTNP